jgi:hypothetical protein
LLLVFNAINSDMAINAMSTAAVKVTSLRFKSTQPIGRISLAKVFNV